MDPIPTEALLAAYPRAMQAIARRLQAIVRRTFPDVIERVRPGWRLIGYDLPADRRTIYFAYVAAEQEHVHLGFEHGWAMRDPHGLVQGAGITKQVRWLTLRPGDPIDDRACADLLREAAVVARMSRGERALRSMHDDR
ncbi:MAG: DUF1801 domain-containing protein [Candidatus Limnocylindrales bacterium]